MSQAEPVVVKHEGQSVRLEPVVCRAYMGGEFAGNVALQLLCDRVHAAVIEDCLGIRLPGDSARLERVATGNPERGIELVFHSEALMNLPELPARVELLWNEEAIASVEPELTESVPVARDYGYVEAARILPNPELSTANAVRLAANRSWLWIFPGACCLAVSAILAFAPGAHQELDPVLRGAAVGLLGLMGVAMLGVGSSVPNRQVWLERDRGRLTVIRGRRLRAPSLESGPHRSLSEFHHVRVFEHSFWDDDHDEQTEWIVSLEGPIPYAHAQGGVHRRDDALLIGTFAHGRSALRRAAEIGHLTGLPILEAGEH